MEYFQASRSRPTQPVRLNIYLAGKMESTHAHDGGCWREGLTGRDRNVTILTGTALDYNKLPIEIGVACEGHNYVGPYYFDSGGGHSTWINGGHGNDPGGQGLPSDHRDRVRSLCLDAIDRCDLLFAWLNCTDCYGTIAEIGYARAARKRIAVASPLEVNVTELWFAVGMADWSRSDIEWPNDALALAIKSLFGKGTE